VICTEKTKRHNIDLTRHNGTRDEALAQHERFSATLIGISPVQDPQREQALPDEVESASIKLAHADTELNQAQLQHTLIAEAEQVPKQTQAAAVGREDQLPLQIYEEMEDWIEEETNRSDEDLAQAAQCALELERINAAKESKREAELHADENIFSDIESMLRGEGADDPLNLALRTHTIAEEKARLLKTAKTRVAEDAARARAALKNS
jgi:hypothetical protein